MNSLETLIQNWKSEISGKEPILPENIEELEDHLRLEIKTLQSTGLSEEESFLIARRRIGKVADLDNEYQKINTRSIWLNRIQWMVIGYFIQLFAIGLFMSLSMALGEITLYYTNSHWVGGIVYFTSIALVFWMIIIIIRQLTGREEPGRVFDFIKKHPVSILASFAVWKLFIPLFTNIYTTFNLPVSMNQTIRMWLAYYSAGTSVLVILFFIGIYLWVRKQMEVTNR